MALARRSSELQALVFDPKYIQFKHKGAGVTLYFSPEFMRKNQRPTGVKDDWYIPVVPTGKSEFHAPNCPVRALRYYHSTFKAHEVRAVATSLQLFNKVDLQAVMKAGRSAGGTFTSFYLGDICPQADRIRKTGPILAEGEIVLIFSSYVTCSLLYYTMLLALGSRQPLSSKKGGPRGFPTRAQADENFLSVGAVSCLSLRSQNRQTALPYLSNSGFIQIVI